MRSFAGHENKGVVTIGQRLVATWGNDTYHGIAEGTDSLGNLLLRQKDGTLLTLTAGDVTLTDH